jgi:hypothetical protein
MNHELKIGDTVLGQASSVTVSFEPLPEYFIELDKSDIELSEPIKKGMKATYKTDKGSQSATVVSVEETETAYILGVTLDKSHD